MDDKKDTSKRTRSKDPMAKWLRTVRAIVGLEQSEFAKYIGKSRSAVAMYETGTPVPLEVVATIVQTFEDLPPAPTGDEIRITGKPSLTSNRATVRFAGTVPASKDWGEPLSATERRETDPKFAGNNRFMCDVSGDSCYPALQPGDQTIWEADENPPYGCIVIAERDQDRACTVKELAYDEQAGRPRLRPINPKCEAPEDGEGWRVVARLVAVIRAVDGPERTWFWFPGLRPHHLV